LRGDGDMSGVGVGVGVVQGPMNNPNNNNNNNLEDGSSERPLLLTQYGESNPTITNQSTPVTAYAGVASSSNNNDVSNDKYASSTGTTTVESDEALAKRLAKEWGASNEQTWTNNNNYGNSEGLVGMSLVGDSKSPSTNPVTKSDEEYARELQAQWNSSTNTDGAVNSYADSMSAMANSKPELDDMELCAINENTELKPSAVTNDIDNFGGGGRVNPQVPISTTGPISNGRNSPDSTSVVTFDDATTKKPPPQQQMQFDFEKFGESFRLWHYNGLRGGKLTSFQVTRLSAQEAVGASVALSTNDAAHSLLSLAGHSGAGGGGSGNGGDLEDIVRTKYPSCTFDWGGKPPPFID